MSLFTSLDFNWKEQNRYISLHSVKNWFSRLATTDLIIFLYQQNIKLLTKTILHGSMGLVMNLVTTHYNCTSPMDYISHHALHPHIPVHHYTHHTAVTIHSLVLIVSPHLHLIHSHTFKQHSHMHSLRSLVLPWLTFPSVFPSLSSRVLPGLLTSSPDRLLPASLTPPAFW